MEFAIGQVRVSIKIVDFNWGTRNVEIKANGAIGECKIAAEITISENNKPLDVKILVERMNEYEKKSINN